MGMVTKGTAEEHAAKARFLIRQTGMKFGKDDKLASAQIHATLAVYELLKAQQEQK
jgi:hypothetical protein